MNIKKFKEGDLITRSAPTTRGDRSYQNDEMELIGVESGMIVLVRKDWADEFSAIKLETDEWSDGWDYFPVTLWEKAKARARDKVKNYLTHNK
jgi:hypothetical protein